MIFLSHHIPIPAESNSGGWQRKLMVRNPRVPPKRHVAKPRPRPRLKVRPVRTVRVKDKHECIVSPAFLPAMPNPWVSTTVYVGFVYFISSIQVFKSNEYLKHENCLKNKGGYSANPCMVFPSNPAHKPG